MDKSKEYIKMCQKAIKLQDNYKLKTGDMYASFFSQGGLEHVGIFHYDSKVLRRDLSVWLPRIDQLLPRITTIELMGNPAWALDKLVVKISCDPDVPDNGGPAKYWSNFDSYEQLFLACIMNEKYGKKWNGTEWLKEN